MTIFVDDVNVPLKTAWGDQTTSETLRQLIELKGFYSVEKPGDFCSILDTQVCNKNVQTSSLWCFFSFLFYDVDFVVLICLN